MQAVDKSQRNYYMLKSSLVSELYARFVWRDVTDRDVLPIGWSQCICIATDHLRIWCNPLPDFLGAALTAST